MARKSVFIVATLVLFFVGSVFLPPLHAAGAGIRVDGGGSYPIHSTFEVTLFAEGAEFDALQGAFTISGPIEVVSVVKGEAGWLNEPSASSTFVAVVTPTSYFDVAKVTLRGTSIGKATLAMRNVRLARKGVEVGTDAGSTDISITSETTPPSPKPTSIARKATPKPTPFTYPSVNPSSKVTSVAPSTTAQPTPAATYLPGLVENSTLPAPSNISLKKTADFNTDTELKQVTGLTVSGTTTPGYYANIELTPTPPIPEGKKMYVPSDETGHFTFTIDFPLPEGSYALAVYGRKDSTVTPRSRPLVFNVLASGEGRVTIQKATPSPTSQATAAIQETESPATPSPTSEAQEQNPLSKITLIGIGLLGLLLVVLLIKKVRNRI